jgi:hypothetical protein
MYADEPENACVLSSRHAVKNIAELALEINGPHFAGGRFAAQDRFSFAYLVGLMF